MHVNEYKKEIVECNNSIQPSICNEPPLRSVILLKAFLQVNQLEWLCDIFVNPPKGYAQAPQAAFPHVTSITRWKLYKQEM